jgi:adenylosuccinate lyase
MKTRLNAISPLDGRYREKLADLNLTASEYGLIRFRLYVEIQWFILLASTDDVAELPPLSTEAQEALLAILNDFNDDEALKVKTLEAKTNHDIKAVEYYLKGKLKEIDSLAPHLEWVHFGLTSEDVNNIAYALMMQELIEQTGSKLDVVLDTLESLATQTAHIACLARTHGQAASPTTLGKELINTVARLDRQQLLLGQTEILAKCNGAVGNFNALAIAYPDTHWPTLAKSFVEALGLSHNAYTTQIEPHDALADVSHRLALMNTILIDFARDVWTYISLGYFVQAKKDTETGSSTMPHKVNPIDFENAEGNLGLSNALFYHFATKLPISRLQRDLSDSTVLRNIGSAFAYQHIAFDSLLKGLNKLSVDADRVSSDLNDRWELLGEAVQTVMRRYGLENPYEQLKNLTRGKKLDCATLHDFIKALDIPEKAKDRLLALTPETYTGYAGDLVDKWT